MDSADGPVLPVISIPRWSRTVKEVQAKLERLFGIAIVIIDISDSRGAIGFVFAETLRRSHPAKSRGFRAVSLDSLQEGEVSAGQRRAILSLIERGSSRRGPFFRRGWLEDAVDWIRQVTGNTDASFEIVQFNASALTVLARVKFARSVYWLKAVAPELNSEYRFTKELARLFPRFLPQMVSYRDEWHAFLMIGGGVTLGHNRQCTLDGMGLVGTSLAQLQLASIQHADALLAFGLSDVRVRTLWLQMRASLPIMERAMSLQDFGGVVRFSRKKLIEICVDVEDLCAFLDDLKIPDTLLHNDLHSHNILIEHRQCAFIDWAHPAIGNPLLAYDQLRSEFLHRPRLRAHFSITYRTVLRQIISPHHIDRTMASLPAFAAVAELQQCLLRASTSTRYERHFARRIRILVRYLDRVLKDDVVANQKHSA